MINNNICIIGGAGHVGTPLGLALSSKGFNVILVDKNKKNINKIKEIFSKEYHPYQIGFVSKEKSKIKTFGKLRW